MNIILNPSYEDIRRYGTLAHVSTNDRLRIMKLSSIGEHGEFEAEKSSIECALKEARKKERKNRR